MCRLRVAWTDLPPFQQAGPGDTPIGIDIKLVEEAARRVPCAVIWLHTPPTRAMVMLREGRVDAFPGVARTPEREVFGIFSLPLRDGRNTLIVRRGTSGDYPFNSLTDLAASSFRLGVLPGVRYSPEYESLLASGALADNLLIVQNGASALGMLLRGRLDGFLDGYRVAMERAAKAGEADAIEAHPMPISAHQAFMMFSQSANVPADIISRFNAALIGMAADGTTKRILNKDGS